MLPTATHTITDREAVKGRLSGRTQEIQRLIGRSIRNVFNLKLLGERVLKIDLMLFLLMVELEQHQLTELGCL